MKTTAVEAIPPLLPEPHDIPDARHGGDRTRMHDVPLIRVHTDEGLVGRGTGGPDPAVALVAASLQFMTAMPRGRLVECCIGESPLMGELLAEPFHLEPGGTLGVSRAHRRCP